MELRVIRDAPADGSWNMAVDEALLESAQRGVTTLRFYAWSQPTLSLGYFQRFADRASHSASGALSVVRRTTGGGAIVHDCELTYSLTTPTAALRSAAETQSWYDLLHVTAIRILKELQIPAAQWTASDERQSDERQSGEPFMCFGRRAWGDVVAQGHKLLGSAQRRAKGGLLQHGSLLLGRSRGAPEFPGLAAFLEKPPDLPELVDRWAHAVGMEVAEKTCDIPLTELEESRAKLIQREKFLRSAWTERR